jgi:phosphomannomutase
VCDSPRMIETTVARAEQWRAADPDPDTRAELGVLIERAAGGDAAAATDLTSG